MKRSTFLIVHHFYISLQKFESLVAASPSLVGAHDDLPLIASTRDRDTVTTGLYKQYLSS